MSLWKIEKGKPFAKREEELHGRTDRVTVVERRLNAVLNLIVSLATGREGNIELAVRGRIDRVFEKLQRGEFAYLYSTPEDLKGVEVRDDGRGNRRIVLWRETDPSTGQERGLSFDPYDLAQVTSFNNVCRDMLGSVVDPGKQLRMDKLIEGWMERL
ncbi:MAG: hypothetical protein HY429_04870 [Candidatus Levybacteria bacterium]|nr:hypothetical protein [Candidatus Levybacteria bacterium]